jgi:RNA binding exosome subunit
MDKHIETMKRIVELSDTILEGLEHIKSEVNEGRLGNTVELMKDVTEAFFQIEQSISPFLSELPTNGIENLTESLKTGMEYVVRAYEVEKGDQVFEILQFTLLPVYKKWKNELDRTLGPFISS